MSKIPVNKITRRNLENFINKKENQGEFKFPIGFTIEMFEDLTDAQQRTILTALYARVSNWSKPVGDPKTPRKITKAEFDSIISSKLKFSKTQWKILSDKASKVLGVSPDKLVPGKVKPTWNEISKKMRANFRAWLEQDISFGYDDDFTIFGYDKFPPEIKVQYFIELAKTYDIDDYNKVREWDISKTELLDDGLDFYPSKEIRDAIAYYSDVDGQSDLSDDEIKNVREQRKKEEHIKKLKGKVKNMKSYVQYEEALNDPDFDREMLETIFKRMEKDKAFHSSWQISKNEHPLKLIATHPLTTTVDLLRIKKMKTKTRWNKGQPLYNSSHLNSAMADKNDAPKSEVMSLIKKSQFDLKVKALKRDDLTEEDVDTIIHYTIKQHCHVPSQTKEIFDESDRNIDDYKDQFIATLKGKYTKGANWSTKPTGIKFLEAVDAYGWLDDLSDRDKKEMGAVIAEAYRVGSLKKTRIKNIADNLKGDKTSFLMQIFEATNDTDFLPEEVQDIFIF